MATDEAVAAGLIDWVNSLSVADPVYTVDDLANGQVIWKVLRAFKPDVVILRICPNIFQNRLTASAFLASYLKIAIQTNG